MEALDLKPRIVEQIWKSIAQSGISTANIPPDQMQALVDSIATGVVLTLDDALDDMALPSKERLQAEPLNVESDEPEEVLWEGRPLLSLTSFYQVTNERVRVVTGILGKDREDIELVRIQDLDRSQGMTERMLGIGDIHIRSHDPTAESLTLRNVRNPDHVHEVLRRAMLNARKRFRYTVQEEM
jgi:hypothetical protein